MFKKEKSDLVLLTVAVSRLLEEFTKLETRLEIQNERIENVVRALELIQFDQQKLADALEQVFN